MKIFKKKKRGVFKSLVYIEMMVYAQVHTRKCKSENVFFLSLPLFISHEEESVFILSLLLHAKTRKTRQK